MQTTMMEFFDLSFKFKSPYSFTRELRKYTKIKLVRVLVKRFDKFHYVCAKFFNITSNGITKKYSVQE